MYNSSLQSSWTYKGKANFFYYGMSYAVVDKDNQMHLTASIIQPSVKNL